MHLLLGGRDSGAGLSMRVQGGGGDFAPGIFLCGKFRYFKCVRNFPLNSQAPVRKKLESKFSHVGASPPRRRFFNSSMIRNAWPCSSQSGGIVVVPKGATTPALGTHCLVFFAAGSLPLPLADMEEETDTETDATDHQFGVPSYWSQDFSADRPLHIR